MRDVFDQHYDTDKDGITRGGRGKLGSLRGVELHRSRIARLVKTPCRNIIEELRSLFNHLYLYLPARLDPDPDVQSSIESEREEDENVQNAIRRLQSSEEVLSIINKHLASSWDVDGDDGSYDKVDFRRDSGVSRNRRKRKAEEDGFTNLNDRRRNRFPPRSTQPSQSKDKLGLQGHRSSLGSYAGYD